MKRILILLFIISYTTYAQSSVATILTNEQKARLTSKQRIQLNGFESLKVIDTDENRSYVFRNGQWLHEFSDAEIMAARNRQQSIKNTNESWKEFDELSRPIDSGAPKSPAVTASSNNVATSQPFYYQTINLQEFSEGGFSIKVPDVKRVCFIKVYFKNTPEYEDISLEGTKARKSLSERVASFSHFENSTTSIKFEKNGLNRISSGNNEILGILMAYTD